MDGITVKNNSSVEFIEKKSKFIGHSFYVRNEEEALAAINSVKSIHNTATHNVYAYSLRLFGTQRFNDDGEPQGTAGMPVLSVINNSGLVDVCVVVTRYFGGILLGAGGLVRAYSKAAALALEESGRTPIVLMTFFELVYSYDMHNNIQRILEKFGAVIDRQSFLEKITLTASVPDESFIPMAESIKSIYYNIELKEIKKEYSRCV